MIPDLPDQSSTLRLPSEGAEVDCIRGLRYLDIVFGGSCRNVADTGVKSGPCVQSVHPGSHMRDGKVPGVVCFAPVVIRGPLVVRLLIAVAVSQEDACASRRTSVGQNHCAVYRCSTFVVSSFDVLARKGVRLSLQLYSILAVGVRS